MAQAALPVGAEDRSPQRPHDGLGGRGRWRRPPVLLLHGNPTWGFLYRDFVGCCVYWRSAHGHLYALELADLGRGRPSMATVYGMWERYEPRPPEDQIDADLVDFCMWVAEVSEGLDPEHLRRVLIYAGINKDPPQRG